MLMFCEKNRVVRRVRNLSKLFTQSRTSRTTRGMLALLPQTLDLIARSSLFSHDRLTLGIAALFVGVLFPSGPSKSWLLQESTNFHHCPGELRNYNYMVQFLSFKPIAVLSRRRCTVKVDHIYSWLQRPSGFRPRTTEIHLLYTEDAEEIFKRNLVSQHLFAMLMTNSCIDLARSLKSTTYVINCAVA